MKNKYFATLAFLLFHLTAKGQQIPNGGFETWTSPKQPDGWYTFSSSGFVDLAAKDTTDKAEGKASAKIRTATISFSTTYEILSLGTATFSFTKYTYFPVPFSFRPDTFHFAYQYDSPGTDTATVYIKFIKANNILLETQLDLIKSSSWSFYSFPLSSLYNTSGTPDSLLIQFKSSKTRNNFFGVDGSTLHVDDVHFGYKGSNSSTHTRGNYTGPRILPNPFSGELSILLADQVPTTVSLYNALGQEILRQTFTNSTTINTEQLTNGIYYYQLQNDKGVVAGGKLIRQ